MQKKLLFLIICISLSGSVYAMKQEQPVNPDAGGEELQLEPEDASGEPKSVDGDQRVPTTDEKVAAVVTEDAQAADERKSGSKSDVPRKINLGGLYDVSHGFLNGMILVQAVFLPAALNKFSAVKRGAKNLFGMLASGFFALGILSSRVSKTNETKKIISELEAQRSSKKKTEISWLANVLCLRKPDKNKGSSNTTPLPSLKWRSSALPNWKNKSYTVGLLAGIACGSLYNILALTEKK